MKHYDDVVVKRCHNKIIGSGCNPYSEETKRSRHTAQGSGYCEDCRNRLGLQDLPGRVPDANIGDEEQMRNAGHGGQGRYGQQASYGVDWGYNTTGGPSGTGSHSGTAGSTGTEMYGEYGRSTGTGMHSGYGDSSGTRMHGGYGGSTGTGGYGGQSGTGVQSVIGGQSRTLGPNPGSTEVPIPIDPDRKGGGLSGASVWKYHGHRGVVSLAKAREDRREERQRRREDEERRWEDEKRRREDEGGRREDEERQRGDKRRR